MFYDFEDAMHIERIERGTLRGKRPRELGYNARKGPAGQWTTEELVRITIAGISGFGYSRLTKKRAQEVVGRPVGNVFQGGNLKDRYQELEFPLLDWWGNVEEKPVSALVSSGGYEHELQVACYDTSLYIDDLHLKGDGEAVSLILKNAFEGFERGHRAFKVKIGRGARFMNLEPGMKRDIEIINGLRERLDPDIRILVDANNGYNFNLCRRLLSEVRGADIFWIEEPFHEDGLLFEALKDWMKKESLEVLLADGEGRAASSLVEWAKAGLIDVVQHDICNYGFLSWLRLGQELAESEVSIAPHNFGRVFGNIASCHLHAVLDNMVFVEWDEASVPGLDTSLYKIEGGAVNVPDRPGFGLELDDSIFSEKVKDEGWVVGV